MEKPKISVIVPVYKVEQYLEKCIKSILAQTYRNLEIILIDDGSPDGCPPICDTFAQKDSRIVVVHQINSGVSASRNHGLSIATGDYIAFVDSDDYLAPHAYETMIKQLVADDSDMVVADYAFVDENGNLLDASVQHDYLRNCCYSQSEFIEELLKPYGGFYVPPWTKLYKKELFADNRFPVGKRYEDEYVLHHVVAECRKVSTMRDVVYYYLQRSDGFMAQRAGVTGMDFGDALIDRYHFCKEKRWSAWKNATVSRLSYEMEAWRRQAKEDKKLRRQYESLRKESFFLITERASWNAYSMRGRLFNQLKLLFPVF